MSSTLFTHEFMLTPCVAKQKLSELGKLPWQSMGTYVVISPNEKLIAL